MKLTYTKLPKLLIIFLTLNVSGIAQEAKLRKADKNYHHFAYVKASEIYKDVAESGYESEKLFENLSNALYFNSNYKEAVVWYDKYFKFKTTGEVPPIYYLRYSQSLKSNNKIEESKRYYNLFLEKSNSEGNIKTANEYLEIILDSIEYYKIKKLPLKYDNSNFGTVVHDGQIFFSSARDTGTVSKRLNNWNNQPFMDLYQSSIDEEDKEGYGVPKKIKGKVNTKNHESTPCFSKDGKTMYFTTNSTSKKAKKDVQRLKICKATYHNGKWINIEDLPINSDDYSTAHPVLNNDETKLYFTSDMPGSSGETDIFMVNIEDGRFGLIEKLGNNINTKGRESFPYITHDNKLYFSSDGHYGLGGLDVYYIDLNSDTPKLLNVGKPINSSYDDFAFSIDKDRNGFVSSNRGDLKGYGDIFQFTPSKDKPAPIDVDLYGKIVDKYTSEPITNAKVIVYNVSNQKPEFVTASDKAGKYEIEVKKNQEYTVRVESNNYDKEELYVKTTKKKNLLNFKLSSEVLNTQISNIEEGDSLTNIIKPLYDKIKRNLDKPIDDKMSTVKTSTDSKNVEIRNIYFDFNNSEIKNNDQILALQLIVSVLKHNPTMVIEVQSHTDSRGPKAYNLALSKSRLESTINYLAENGIDRSRLIGKWYGESQLINNCRDGVRCTTSEHKLNRRSEFIIKKL